MQNILKHVPAGDRSVAPWILLLILIVYVFCGIIVFTGAGQFLVATIYGYSDTEVMGLMSNPFEYEDGQLPIMIIQGLMSLGGFVLIPILFIYFHLKLRIGEFLHLPENKYQTFFMTLVIMFCFMVANSVIIEWNQNMDLPDALSPFENWAQAKELQLEKLTNYLTLFDGLGDLLIALIVIAVLPAVGEELLFRGLIQNLFNKAFKNPHVAIWLSAFLFAVFHFQLYGVIPRMLLGALFGYLYYWSGYLSIAVLAHFINNGLTLILLYLSQQRIIDYDPTAANAAPPLFMTIIFAVVGTVLLVLFKNYFDRKEHA